MSWKFLSDEWFEGVANMREEAGDMNMPAIMADLIMNLELQTEDGQFDMCLNGGRFEKGAREDAKATMIMPKEYAYKMFVLQDDSVGMKEFMSGKIKVKGNMAALMPLQSAKPSEEMKAFAEKVKEATTAE